nr:hypothetical protein XXXJIFNMEKO1_EEONHAKH_00015 [Culicoides impunctatus]
MTFVKGMLFSVFFFSGSLYAAEIQGKVIRVLDGDTLEVLQDKKPVRIRLANIDAPEKRQAFGRWSTNQLKGLVAAQPVTVGLLSLIMVQPTGSLSFQLIKNGWLIKVKPFLICLFCWVVNSFIMKLMRQN